MLLMVICVGLLCGFVGKGFGSDNVGVDDVGAVVFHIGLVGVCVWCCCWWSELCWWCCSCHPEGHSYL